MAKFKKKKSTPTSDDSVKEEPIEEIPEIEKESIDPPKKEAKPTQLLSDDNKSKLNKLFWMRVGLAVFAGTAATFLFESIEGESRRWASIGFMVILYLATIVMAKSMRMQLPSSDRKKIVTQAIGSYVFIYLFVWIASYTLVNSSPTDIGIPSPIT